VKTEKSAKSKTSNFGLRSLTFFKCRFKKHKKWRFLDFQKNVKYVFSSYVFTTTAGHIDT